MSPVSPASPVGPTNPGFPTMAEGPEILRRNRQLDPGERFRFACHAGLPCFNTCCADVTIILTPLDVLRLARRTGMATSEFLGTHCLLPFSKDLKLPMVVLKMGSEPDKACPFVGPEGCTVYQDRPWACRMYPVGMALPPARAGVEPQPLHFLFQDDFCHGRDAGREWTVAEWHADQGVEERDRLETGFRDLVSHPWFIGGRQLDPKRMEILFTACYDLDRFRELVFGSSFLERFELEPELIEALRTDDEALLAFAFRWLRLALFAEPTVKVRATASEGRQP